jgi:Beta-lactamase superfamily domain
MTSLELATGGTAEFSEGELYFIGNATTLIRFGGLTILTDPAFLHKGEHVDLGHGIWARREVEPACQIADLPPIDLVILSHYHGDHFDDLAAQELDKKLPIVSTADAVAKLSSLGFEQGYPLDTWESLVVHKGDATLKITAMPAKHATDDAVNALLMPVNGHMLDFSRNSDHLYRLYITGDTMLIDSLEDIPRRSGRTTVTRPRQGWWAGRPRHGSALIQGMPPSPAVAARTMLPRCCARRRAGPGGSSGKSRKWYRSVTNIPQDCTDRSVTGRPGTPRLSRPTDSQYRRRPS